MNTQALIAAALLIAATAQTHAGAPRKCVTDDGTVIYSTDRVCPGGNREWIHDGTFSDVRSQTLRSVDVYKFKEIEIAKHPTFKKEENPRPPITTTIGR